MQLIQVLEPILSWWVDDDTFALYLYDGVYVVLASIHYGSTPATYLFDEYETNAIQKLLEFQKKMPDMKVDEMIQDWIWRVAMGI